MIAGLMSWRTQWRSGILSIALLAAVTAPGMPALQLADGWKVCPDSGHVGLTNGWMRAVRPDAVAASMPYSRAADDPGCCEVWLYREFVPEFAANDRVFLELAGVSYLARAWLNGESLGEHRGGYEAFAFDVSGKLRPGEDNLLVLNVVVPGRDFRVDGNLGSQMPVWRKHPQVQRAPVLRRHGEIALTGAYLRSDWKAGTFSVELELDATRERSDVEVIVEVREHKRDVVIAESRQRVPVAAGRSSVKLAEPIRVPGFRLWSPDDPSCYDVTIRLEGEETVVRTGFRDLRVDDSGYFVLNGRRIFLKCTHMASELPGAIDLPVRLSELYKTLLFLKMSGLNAIRFINCPAFPEVMDLCDEIGLMMYEEHPMAWLRYEGRDSARHFRDSVTQLVRRDRNHPSLMIFGLLNEVESVPSKAVFNVTARDLLPELRTLAPDLLFMYHSGRWDAKRDVASAANPGMSRWEAWMGDEGPGAPPETLEPKHGSRNHPGRGDIHFYPHLPLGEDAWRTLDRLTKTNRRAAVVSESGYGSMANVIANSLLATQNGYSRRLWPFSISDAQSKVIRAAFDAYGLYSIWPTPEEMIKESEALSAARRAELTTMIRRLPKVNGYSITMAQDLNAYGEGLVETDGGLKRGMADMLEEQLADLRFCVSSTNRTLYAGAAFPLEVALSDFGVLKPNVDYPIALRIAGPGGVVWKRELRHRVELAADGQPLPVKVLFAGMVDTGGWKPGRYQVGAEFLAGAHADCGTLAFTLADPAVYGALKDMTLHMVNGVHPNIKGFFRRVGAKLVDIDFGHLPSQGVLFVGWKQIPDATIDRLVECARTGVKVVFLQPEAISRPDATGVPRRLPFKAGVLKRTNNWLYHAESLVLDSPLTAGLPPPGVMDTGFYRHAWGNNVFLKVAKPELPAILSAYVGIGGRDQQECEIGVQLGAYRVGKGWIVLNTLRLDLSGGEPAADLILRNLVLFNP